MVRERGHSLRKQSVVTAHTNAVCSTPLMTMRKTLSLSNLTQRRKRCRYLSEMVGNAGDYVERPKTQKRIESRGCAPTTEAGTCSWLWNLLCGIGRW